MGKSRQGACREHSTWALPLVRSVGRILWVPRIGLDWTIQTKKSRVWVSSWKILPKRAQGEALERQERILITRDVGEVAFTCDFVAVIQGVCLHEGLVSVKLAARHLAKQNGCQGSDIFECLS